MTSLVLCRNSIASYCRVSVVVFFNTSPQKKSYWMRILQSLWPSGWQAVWCCIVLGQNIIEKRFIKKNYVFILYLFFPFTISSIGNLGCFPWESQLQQIGLLPSKSNDVHFHQCPVIDQLKSWKTYFCNPPQDPSLIKIHFWWSVSCCFYGAVVKPAVIFPPHSGLGSAQNTAVLTCAS